MPAFSEGVAGGEGGKGVREGGREGEEGRGERVGVGVVGCVWMDRWMYVCTYVLHVGDA